MKGGVREERKDTINEYYPISTLPVSFEKQEEKDNR
jgi:hypothetical protein